MILIYVDTWCHLNIAWCQMMSQESHMNVIWHILLLLSTFVFRWSIIVCKSRTNCSFVNYLNYLFQILEKIQEAKNAEIQLNNLKINLFPLARRATELFCILRSLAVIHREYQFSLNIFNNLFDEALGGKSPSDFGIHQTEKVSFHTQHLLHFFHI